MTLEQKAKIILKHLDTFVNVDWNFEKEYINAIMKGLIYIQERERGENTKVSEPELTRSLISGRAELK